MLNQHQTIKDNIAKYNKENPLADYLVPFMGNKEMVTILDVGSGPYSTIGHVLNERNVMLSLVDNQDFTLFWEKYNTKPYYLVEYQDMEKLTFDDNSFDIVHSANALDHTDDALVAAQEMIRVCKPGGWVYIDCHLDQADTGHKHKWNAKADGMFINGEGRMFNLRQFGFQIRFIDNGGESRYNKIIATLQKI